MFNEWKILCLIIVIFIAACIETDIYLPAFIDMMHFFSVSEGEIQSLLTWNFAAICLSGPLYGPLSDVFGRKKPLMVALGLFLIGSIATLFATNFDWMLLGRVLQGLGSGGCFTLGTAIIFDSFQKEKAIQALNKINSVVPFIMAGAPMLGGYLNQMYGFRFNFSAIALCVLISFIICLLFFDEPISQEKRIPLNLKQIGRDFKKVTCSLPFLANHIYCEFALFRLSRFSLRNFDSFCGRVWSEQIPSSFLSSGFIRSMALRQPFI